MLGGQPEEHRQRSMSMIQANILAAEVSPRDTNRYKRMEKVNNNHPTCLRLGEFWGEKR